MEELAKTAQHRHLQRTGHALVQLLFLRRVFEMQQVQGSLSSRGLRWSSSRTNILWMPQKPASTLKQICRQYASRKNGTSSVQQANNIGRHSTGGKCLNTNENVRSGNVNIPGYNLRTIHNKVLIWM